MAFDRGIPGAPGAMLIAPPKRYRLVLSEKMLPSLRLGALEAKLVPFLKICPHIEVSALLKAFDRSIVSMVVGIETDTLPFVTWSCQHKAPYTGPKPLLRPSNRSQFSSVDIELVVDHN